MLIQLLRAGKGGDLEMIFVFLSLPPRATGAEMLMCAGHWSATAECRFLPALACQA